MKFSFESVEALVRVAALIDLRGVKVEDLPKVLPDFFRPTDMESTISDATREDIESGLEEIDQF